MYLEPHLWNKKVYARNCYIGKKRYTECSNSIHSIHIWTITLRFPVAPPSVIRSDKTLVSGLRGESLKVYCEVQALSPFNMTWIKKNGNINFNNTQFTEMEHETFEPSSPKIIIYIKRSTMTISKLTDINTGRYQCMAYNLGGQRYTIVHVRMNCKMKYFFFLQFYLLSQVYRVFNSLFSYQREK